MGYPVSRLATRPPNPVLFSGHTPGPASLGTGGWGTVLTSSLCGSRDDTQHLSLEGSSLGLGCETPQAKTAWDMMEQHSVKNDHCLSGWLSSPGLQGSKNGPVAGLGTVSG